MRTLPEPFLQDLLQAHGHLHPILRRVKKDQTLMLAIRENAINIYYRGGNLVRIAGQTSSRYKADFDAKYNLSGQALPALPANIQNQEEAVQWMEAFPILKQVMDEYFCIHSKPEREFQQLVARENNHSTISNESEYFISDIEFADSDLHARFDLQGIRWDASRRSSGQCRPALFEMKYGDNALGGASGLLKHLQDIDALVQDKVRYGQLLATMESQFCQLDQLGLLKFTRSQVGIQVSLATEIKPEVIFVLANHNPRSTKLMTMLESVKLDEYARSAHFDLRFFVSSFAGYGLHTRNMLTLGEFRKLL
ncbi:MAG: hypothetical protein RBS68_13605 [Anaerolineales bacterium]|nr:hypothetical protein [Anaerolineales bacterium]